MAILSPCLVLLVTSSSCSNCGRNSLVAYLPQRGLTYRERSISSKKIRLSNLQKIPPIYPSSAQQQANCLERLDWKKVVDLLGDMYLFRFFFLHLVHEILVLWCLFQLPLLMENVLLYIIIYQSLLTFQSYEKLFRYYIGRILRK